MFIPLKDDNPTRSFPFVNLALILVNVGVFLYMGTLPGRAQEAFLLTNAEIPRHVAQFLAGRLSFEVAFRPLITSMFLHGGWMHIIGNMLFLYIFGDNIEDYFGHFGYLAFYFVCGIGAGLMHIIFNLNSMVPALGASGAISGVMGAYAVLFPRNRILTLVFIFLVPIPAIFILGYWFLLQFLEGIGRLGMGAQGGVAWWAHIGGFLLGVLITLIVKKK